MKVIADVLYYIAGLFKESHSPRCITGIVVSYDQVIIPAWVKFQLSVLDKVGRKLNYMYHLGRLSVLELGSGNRRYRLLKKICRAIEGVHILVQDPPHMSALASDYPLYTQPFGFGVYLGIQPFRHFHRCEEAEVAAFRCVRAPGVVEVELVEEHKVSHGCVSSGIGEEVA